MASEKVSVASIKQNLPHHIKAQLRNCEEPVSIDDLKKIYLKLWQEQVEPKRTQLSDKNIHALRCQILTGISKTKAIFEQLVEALDLQDTISSKNIPKFNQTKETEEVLSTHKLRFTYGVCMPISRGGGVVMSLTSDESEGN